jgi:hypothetical protein
MSALGQKRTCAVHYPMSALPPKATSNATSWNVRFGPKADIAHLVDDLVGGGEQRLRERQAQCLSRLEV